MDCSPEREPHTNVGDRDVMILLFACQCGDESHQWQCEVPIERVRQVQ